MQRSQQDLFWRLYEKQVRTPVERACRRVSRTLTDNAMDPSDMVAWVDQRVWRMLEKGAWPTFHDDPTPEVAVERLEKNAATLARWAHLALVRKTFRRTAREAAYEKARAAEIHASVTTSRVEALAATSGQGAAFEQNEQIGADLARVRAAVAERVRQKLAASWPEAGERQRIAMALGVTDEQTDDLIESTTTGDMKVNTVQQMRSRAMREARSIIQDAASKPARAAGSLGKAVGAFLLAVMMLLTFSPSSAYAGEQTGGRGGSRGGRSVEAMSSVEGASHGPSAGAAANTQIADTLKKEQTGGRGPTR